MNRRFRAAVLLVATAAMTACSTMQPVTSAQTSLHTGDQIQVKTTSGKTFDLQVTAVDQTGVSGTTNDKIPVQIAFSDVASIEREEPDAARSYGLAAIIIAVMFGLGALGGHEAGSKILTPK